MRKDLSAKMKEKERIDARELAYVRDPSVEEKLVLELAEEIHRAESDDCAISWSAQERATTFYNEHGFIEALTRMTDLRSLRENKKKRIITNP